MRRISGSSLYEGYGFGEILAYRDSTGASNHESLGYDAEKKRYEEARQKVIKSLEDLRQRSAGQVKQESLDIIDAHLAMLDDLDYADGVEQGLNDGQSAEAAVNNACSTICEMLRASGDEYIAGRASDVEEISRQITRALSGLEPLVLTKPTILCAWDLGVSTLLSLDRKYLSGVVLYHTGKTSHVAIVIRSLGIPCFIAADDFTTGLDGKSGILDGGKGLLYTDYDSSFEAEYREKDRLYREEVVKLESFRGKPAVSKDGKHIEVCCNIAKSDDVTPEMVSAADGIGLFRSEFLYLESSDYPNEETQFQAYKKAVEAFGQKQTIIRTFDIGTDKKADYFQLPDEDNPALGYRSIRICRDRPGLFLTQLRALCRASAYGNLAIMIPMIMDEKELDYALEMVHKAQEQLAQENIPFNKNMKVGIMVETPAAAVISDKLAKKAAFFSIGTNDLTQYTLALDRTNQNVARFLDPHHPAVLRLMKLTADNAHKAGIPVGICGELGHDEYLLPFFLKIGIDELSMVSTYVLKTKSMVSEIDVSKVDLDKYIG